MFHVADRSFKSGCTNIHTDNFFCTTSRCVYRESASISKNIEHRFILGKFFNPRTIVTLVEEETSLLPAQWVRLKDESIFFEEDQARRSPKRECHPIAKFVQIFSVLLQ